MVICSWGCWNTDERGSNIGCHGKPNKGFQGSNPWNPPWAMVLAIRSPCGYIADTTCEPWKEACTESTAPDPIWQCYLTNLSAITIYYINAAANLVLTLWVSNSSQSVMGIWFLQLICTIITFQKNLRGLIARLFLQAIQSYQARTGIYSTMKQPVLSS